MTSNSTGIPTPSQISGLNTSGEIKAGLGLRGNCLAASSRDVSALGYLGDRDVVGPGVSYNSVAFFEDCSSVLNIWQCVRLGFLCPSADLGSGSHCQGPCQGHGARKRGQKSPAEITLRKGIVSSKVNGQEGSWGIGVLRGEGQLQHQWAKHGANGSPLEAPETD